MVGIDSKHASVKGGMSVDTKTVEAIANLILDWRGIRSSKKAKTQQSNGALQKVL